MPRSTAVPTRSDPAVYDDEDLDAAVAAVREHVGWAPEMALILGSGLGRLAEAADETTVVPAAEIPGYPESTVEGHSGTLVFGALEDTRVVFVQGRVHLYEGYPVQQIAMPVRLVHALGADRMLVTNSAGGINRTFDPGTLMFITGHLNMAFASPGVGAGAAPARQRPEEDRVPFYDQGWTNRAEKVALDLELDARRGTYAWTLGPSYETKAEVRALEHLGADAVGMSTVPEVIQAHQLGMTVLGLSTITNPAAGLAAGALDHDEVLEVSERVRGDLMKLVRGIVRVADV
ncbi:purine-nucleoside phosphorylase [Salinibacter grassmerensis]|uniref:purine-nucleoside phosphorylase n=1 Tax=Salinibacter grassmerensis TaxID=3040353 RepID=UPI0021E6EF8F|nr:purine-nucleoside phosphorylase [Salinibacter grassmerensis]